MKDLQREILTQVAAGTITAEEGAARLDALLPTTAGAPAPKAREAAKPAEAAPGVVRELKLISRFGSTEIVGDPTVTSAVADGPHRARQDGDTLVIEHSPAHE